MAVFTPKPSWADLDFSAKAKTWQQNRAGTQVATGNSKIPIEALRQSINHLAAYHPATIFCQNSPIDYRYKTTADPLMQWQSYDYHGNNRDATIGMILWSAGNDGAYFYRDDDITYRSGDLAEIWHSTFEQIKLSRNDPTLDFTTDGLCQYATNEMQLQDMVVQEDPVFYLDSSADNCAAPSGYRDMSPIRTTELEDIRGAFHQMRTRNLPMALCWSALTEDGCASTQTSDCTGIAITDTTPVNIWDVTSTSRTATTPGSHVYGYRSAIGNETHSTLAKVLCSAKARVIDNSGGAVGYVRFVGPDHVADNYCDIAVTDTTFSWSGGGSSDFVYLNSAADYNYSGTEKNKIDIHGYVTSTDVLQVLGVVGWRVYE